MKRITVVFAAMVALVFFGQGCAPKATISQPIAPMTAAPKQALAPTVTTAKAEVVATAKTVKLENIHETIVSDSRFTAGKEDCIFGKLVWNGANWIGQVGTYSKERKVPKDHPAYAYVASLPIPERQGAYLWEPYGHRLYDCGAAIPPRSEATPKAEMAAAPPVAPKVEAAPAPNLQEKLDALKTKLAAAETAEKKRLAEAMAEADKEAKKAANAAAAKAEKARKAAEAARRAEAAKKATACLEGLKKLGYEGVEGIKKFQSKYALTADGVAGSSTCAQMRAVLAACTDCKDEPAAAPAAPAEKK